MTFRRRAPIALSSLTLLALWLAACGGGGGDESAAPADAQGGAGTGGAAAGAGGTAGTAGTGGSAAGKGGAAGGGAAGAAGASGASGQAGQSGAGGAAGAGGKAGSGGGGAGGASGAAGASGAGAAGASGSAGTAGSAGNAGNAGSAGNAGKGGGGGGGSAGASGGAGAGGAFVPPTICAGAVLDGVKSVILAPSLPVYDPDGSFTVEAWIHPTGIPASGSVIAGHWEYATDQPSYVLFLQPTGKIALFASANGVATFGKDTATPIQLNVWSHVAGVFDLPSQTLRVYVNGGSETVLPVTMAKPHPIAGTQLHLGNYPTQDASQASFLGLLHDVRFSSVARYTSPFKPEVKLTSDGSTFALFHLDETSGTTASDASSNANTATLKNGAKFGAPASCSGSGGAAGSVGSAGASNL